MKKTFELEQQTSMWHFQGHEAGAALRATEVKPKLDRFLIEWCKKMHQLDILKEKKNWRADKDHPAFAYKLRIENKEGNRTNQELLKNTLSFGVNLANKKDKDNAKLAIKAKEPLQLTIMCFHRDLLEMLIECLPTFFLRYNFGTRQSKGFGSFVLKDSAAKAEQLLTDWYGDKPIYVIDYDMEDSIDEKELFHDIEVIYQALKGGINLKNQNVYIKGFIIKYFLRKKIGGEKRYLKEKKIAPRIGMNKPEGMVNDYRYIRALLGISNTQRWKDDEGKGVFVKIRDKDDKIQRVPSPILFKPVANRIDILANDVNTNIYGKRFNFKCLGNEYVTLNIPQKNEFNINKFFASFVEELNSLETNGIRDNLKKMETVPLFVRKNIKVLPCKGVNH